MNKVKDLSEFPEEFERLKVSKDPKEEEKKKLVLLVAEMTQKEASKRPFSKDLMSQFEDQLFQDYFIEHQSEFSKMVGYLFKNRFKFKSRRDEMDVVDQESRLEGKLIERVCE